MQTAPELDVTKVALRSRPEVIKIIGRPDSSAEGADGYQWGTVTYVRGQLSQIDYLFNSKASSVKEALEKVGLKPTSEPFKGPLTFYWNPSTGPLVCCGFEMDNVVIPLDFSGISVGFKRKLEDQRTAGGKASAKSSTKPDEFLGARIALAQLLEEGLKKEGRFITVSATGDQQQTLEMSSALIGKGTNTLAAAKRETIDSEDSMALIRRVQFKKLIIKGGDYVESYPVAK